MCIQTLKIDSMGNPSRAKSRIVVLGNLKTAVWSTLETYIYQSQPKQ